MKYLIIIASALTTFVSSSFSQHITYISSAPTNCTATASCPGANAEGNYFEQTAGFVIGDFGARGTAVGRGGGGGAVRPAPRGYIGSSDIADPAFGVDILPALEPNKVYKIDYNFSSAAGNTTTDAIFSVAAAGADLSFTETDKFQRKYGNPANQWQTMGFITNGSGTPTISFRYLSGRINGTAQLRMLWDCWRFTEAVPCLATPVVSVVGPLSTNVQEVVVAGVTNATKVTVYQNSGGGMVQIGSKTADIIDGNNTVTVTGLVKGAQVAATQTVNAQEGCVPAIGTVVGGGANPNLRIAVNIRENIALAGPVGAAGSGGILHFLGATGVLARIDSLNGAPSGGTILTPSTNWQTVSFTNGISPLFTWFGTDATPGTWDGQFGALDGLALASEGDGGPFDIYIDDLENGTNGIFQNWESATLGASSHGFFRPFTGSGTTSGDLLPAPDIAEVVNTAAFTGAQSLRVRFQFEDSNIGRWLRLVTTGATPVSNPQVETTQPVSFKILLLPVGAALPPLPVAAPTIGYSLSGSQLTLTWTGTFNLQFKDNLNDATWTTIGNTSPYVTTVEGAAKFYQLQAP